MGTDKTPPQPTPSEQVDFGQFFTLLEGMANKIIRFIKNIIKGLLHSIILFLKFIRPHFVKFILVAVFGFILGFYLDMIKAPVYRSTMIVEPNFYSSQQLYNNIEFYNKLAEEKEYNNLASALKISTKEAKTIKSVAIESFSNENQRLKQFSDFVATLDSTSRESLSYDDYLKNFNFINARFHKITIEAENPEVAKMCQNQMVRSIANNPYFLLQKRTNDRNIKIDDSIIALQMIQVDSLQKFYKKLKLIAANKKNASSQTSIHMSGSNQRLDNSEIQLLAKSKRLNNTLLKNNKRKANTKNIVNIISDFPNRGALVNDWLRQFKILIPVGLTVIIFLILVLLELNRFLINYKELDWSSVENSIKP